MARRVFVRLLGASAVLAAGLSPMLPAAASAAEGAPQERVVPATLRSTPPAAQLYGGSTLRGHDGAGELGVFHTLEGSGLVWTRYADGSSVKVVHPAGYTRYQVVGGDFLAHHFADGRVDLWNAADGTTRTVRLPEGMSFLTAFGDLVVTVRKWQDEAGTSRQEQRLLIPEADGGWRDVPITGMPEGYALGHPEGGDADGLLFVAARPGTWGPYVWVMVDKRTGQVQSVTPPSSVLYPDARVTSRHVVLFDTSRPTVKVYSRADLSAAPAEVVLNASGSGPARDLAVVGDWLVHRPSASGGVQAKPIAGGPSVTLLPRGRNMAAATDGSAVAIGTMTANGDGWGVQRIQPGPDGRPVVTQVKPLPRPPARIRGLLLDQGRLVVADDTRVPRALSVRTVAATGTPEFGARQPYGQEQALEDCPAAEGGCRLYGTGDDRVVRLAQYPGAEDHVKADGPLPDDDWTVSVPDGGRITDVSGRYLIHTTATAQTVLEIGRTGAPAVTRAPGAAALSGHLLWTAGTTPGSVSTYNLVTKRTTGAVTTDAGCVPDEIQVLGRYLYWTCDGKAGIYDRVAKKSVPVPTGEARLGDGFVVTHDKQAGELTLTGVADGSPMSRVIGDLPDTGSSQREVRWTVDEAGANAAYVDAEERVHLVPSGVAQQPLALLASAENAPYVRAREIDTTPDTLTTLLLSKPSSGWDLTVRSRATGTIYSDGRDGTAARGELRVGWHGDDPARSGDAFVPSGIYDWTLTVTPADGVGAPLQVRGTVRLREGAPVHHDHVGLRDGTGDLVTLSSSGALTFHQGTGTGAFSARVSGSGWWAGAAVVPFGDLNGDRCNDVLVRMTDGSLRGYMPGCGKPLTPSTAYSRLGTGWNAHNVLTVPGDLTGDGRPDLLARRASTGDLRLYAARADGGLVSAKKIASGWNIYTKVVGAGDLTGDGIGDVLARDRAGNLWRYDGTGGGALKGRVKVFSNWGASYNAVVGVGDITGDGKSDLVARDTAGNLYRQAGTGMGSFTARVRIGTGWQGYKGLF
ncbi:FG-GAP repeat domain-containing protein [Streptomyces sp. NPDC058739]|uniref:FG-GAP repeat domain-containing protein n=1 Tax=Streptomyces sp. NPDC058739 TaxID=3346618 RepID=UPI003687F564